MNYKNALGVLALIASISFILCGCSNNDSINKVDNSIVDNVEADENSEVYIDVEVNENEGKPFFIIMTNLPNETNLMLTINNESDYEAQSKATVYDGKAESESFSNFGEPLKGDYTLEICTPFAMVMSESVQEIIGEHGENLTGDLVDESDEGEKRIITYVNFTIN